MINMDLQKPIIWTLWWQGEQNAPPIVKACIESMRKYSGEAKVIVLNQYNYQEYVTLPAHILRKFRKGCFSITHLSDILRMNLLCKWGGVWFDSTILISETIPSWIFNIQFYSIKMRKDINTKCIADNRWTSFLIGGEKQNIVLKLLCDMFSQYWLEHDHLVCYLMIDYFMNEIYLAVPEVRKQIDVIPYYKKDILAFSHQLNLSCEKLNIPQGAFHKLSWKEHYVLRNKNKETIYSIILKSYNLDTSEITNTLFDSKLIRKIKSFGRHFYNLFDIKKIYEFGFEICFITFLKDCFRTSNGKLAKVIMRRYNTCIINYLRKRKYYDKP